ncbi:MAG TPA: dihydroorotase [Bacteroidales bacterium]|nr:dihydroorotase [Bacteroidales bacterium]
MASAFIIRGATIVNESALMKGDVVVHDGLIEEILQAGEQREEYKRYSVLDAKGLYLLPGLIDDQVHFREPGLTHKADIGSESRAAVAGGITSFMEMPNTIPNTLTQDLLEEKYAIAATKAWCNYSFYMGASNDNLKELLRTDPATVCGIKVFMGASTGNMLVDNPKTLEGIFAEAPTLVAVHAEYEPMIRENTLQFMSRYGDSAPASIHPLVRHAEACYRSSAQAVELAAKHGTRLHVLHLSTAREMQLFCNDRPLAEKRITAEVCLHHLWFSDEDYLTKGNYIKWNPAVKSAADREALWEALATNKLDVLATDHAPHTSEEKNAPYFKAPSGGPLVQHLLPAMLEKWKQGKISLEKIVEKACHAPAIAFRIRKRGFIRKGYYADLVLVNPEQPWTVSKDNILYKCQWSPLEGTRFSTSVATTIVNGQIVYDQGRFGAPGFGMRLLFDR